MRKDGKSFVYIANHLQISTSTASKYAKMDYSKIPEEHVSIREKEHIDAVNKMKCTVEKVHLMYNQGLDMKEISKLTGYSTSSISKYLSEDYNVVHGQYGVSRPGLLEPYRNEVLSLRAQGVKYEDITNIIREKGYTGSVAALRGFVSKEKRIAKDLLKEKEPCELIDKKYILSERKSTNFEEWIKKSRELKINEIDTYLNGLQNDYDSVINAIRFDYNNGLAEGSVNKLKNIKRIMYGRNSFELLRHKVIKLEKLRKFGDL